MDLRALFALAFVVPATLLAQTPASDPGSVSEADGGEIRQLVSVNFTENAPVSGTNVEIIANGKEGPDVEEPPDDDPPSEPIHCRRKGYRLKIGGVVVASGGSLAVPGTSPGMIFSGGTGGTGGPGAPGGPPSMTAVDPPIKVRFASTHFADDAAIVIEMTCEFERQSRAHAGSTYYDLPVRTVTATRTVKAYNRLLAWKTTRDDHGNRPFSYQSIVDAVLVEGHSAFTAAKYYTIPLLLGPDLLNHPQIPSHAGTSTAWFLNSHGNNDGVQDSGYFTGISATTSAGQFKYWSTWRQVAYPLDLAIVAAYACATMPDPDLKDIPLRQIDGVYLGFETTIYAQYIPASGTSYTLDQHANVFCDALKNGLTAEDAMSKANKNAQDSIGFSALKMA